MKYVVEATKTMFGEEAYKVVNKQLESKEDWIYEVNILGLVPNENGDIITPFFEFLDKNFNSAQVERESIVDSKLSRFSGISVIKVKFIEFNEANGYAAMLNTKLKSEESK